MLKYNKKALIHKKYLKLWETGLSVPDSEMLIQLSEIFDISVNELLGENIEERKADDLKIIAEKLEVINLQLARNKENKIKIISMILLILLIVSVLIFILLIGIKSPYLNFDYNNPQWAVVGVLMHMFEWIYIRVFPVIFILLISGIIFIKRRTL